jgi:hypothetical protein
MDPLSCQQVTGGACGAFSCEADEGMLYNWSGDAPSYASLPAAIPAGFVTRIDSTTADGKGQWQLAGLWAPPACVEVGVVVLQCGYEGTACVDHGTLVAKKEGAKRAILVSFLRLHDGPPGASVVTRVDGAGAPLAAGIKDICKSGGKACAEALVNETLMGSAGGTLPDDAAILRQDAKSNHAGDKVEVYLAVRPETGGLPFPGVHNPHARAMAVMIEF